MCRVKIEMWGRVERDQSEERPQTAATGERRWHQERRRRPAGGTEAYEAQTCEEEVKTLHILLNRLMKCREEGER